ncbi:hydroxyacylglutathione hydrolase [Deinobacterium chartae]|uniref:Hydroxyacylglutathione hydrolase n=1 Tax=Deinobacterium chartae TaxID=521158 RepID=A0A841HYC8_9DEIO|nr:MBL fold metallo-hydrolase [Deinobacterium chartae]MBB6096922.1 hydroxyacylglutathione hydrolase [Deinobacterium chartae]
MFFERIFDPDLAQASFIVGDAGSREVAVIDPGRDPTPYLELLSAQRLRLRAVLETHVHADYLSGARELADLTGAALYLSAEGGEAWRYRYPHHPLKDGDLLALGRTRLWALHTPGHTPEHLGFLFEAPGHTPRLLSGDALFVGDLGRPDLLDEVAGGADTRFEGARQMFTTLQRLLGELPGTTEIWPGHGAGSACGRSLGSEPSSTLAQEQRGAWWGEPLARGDLEAFCRALLEDQPDAPEYFGRMKRMNLEGPPPLGEPEPLMPLDPDRLGSLRLLDVRPLEAYRAGSAAGALHLPAGSHFETWAGWLLDPAEEHALLGVGMHEAERLRRQLWQVGIDRVRGYLEDLSRLPQAPLPGVTPSALEALEDAVIVDVRARSEYAGGHIPGARQIHTGRLRARLQDLPRERPLVVHCQSGARSAAAASLLRSHGFDNVLDLEGGYAAWLRHRTTQPQ